MLIDVGLFTCGILGIGISAYFTLVYYTLMSPNQWFIPRICQMEEHTCQYVIHTSDANLAGVPNSLLGMGYYTGIIVYAGSTGLHSVESINQFMVAVSAGTIILSTYLVYALLLKLKVDCILCYTCHALNVIILILLITRTD